MIFKISIMGSENLSFQELERTVDEIRHKYWAKNIFHLIEKLPIDEESVNILIEEGWYVRHESFRYGSCHHKLKRINLNLNLKPYDRDLTLFHEIGHAWYGEELNDGPREFHNHGREKCIIIEWLSVKLRANSDILKHAVLSF